MQYSKKRKKQVREYKKIKIQFLEDNPLCEVCGGRASDLHHKLGRMGDMLTEVKYFLSVCREDHIKIELNPKWAKEKGYSLNRLDIY